MEQVPKDGKRGTSQSFFNLQSAKKQKFDSSLISTEMIISQSDKVVPSLTTSEQQQQEKVSLLSSSEFSPLLSAAPINQQQNRSAPLEFSSLMSSSSNNPSPNNSLSNIMDISRSMNELPSQSHLVIYPLNKNKRSVSSQ